MTEGCCRTRQRRWARGRGRAADSVNLGSEGAVAVQVWRVCLRLNRCSDSCGHDGCVEVKGLQMSSPIYMVMMSSMVCSGECVRYVGLVGRWSFGSWECSIPPPSHVRVLYMVSARLDLMICRVQSPDIPGSPPGSSTRKKGRKLFGSVVEELRALQEGKKSMKKCIRTIRQAEPQSLSRWHSELLPHVARRPSLLFLLLSLLYSAPTSHLLLPNSTSHHSLPSLPLPILRSLIPPRKTPHPDKIRRVIVIWTHTFQDRRGDHEVLVLCR